MANDNETLFYRIRVIAENLGAFRQTAKASDDVNRSMKDAARLAESLVGANKKLTVARDKEQDSLGKLRVAELRLQETRDKTNVKLSQIVDAENKVATARRNAARATSDANRIEDEFRKLAQRSLENNSSNSGTRAGRSWTKSFLNFFKGSEGADNIAKSGTIVGRTFGSGFGSGIEAILHTEAGPAILAGMIAAVGVAAPAIGAVLGGGIVAGLGAGLVTIGVLFAAKANWVRDKWANALAQTGADMQLISKPFQSVLAHAADVFQATVDKFNPVLRQAFASMAPVVSRFVDATGGALARLVPAIQPISNAFNQVLKALGPGLDSAIKQIASGLISLSNSIARNPTGLADFVSELGHMTKELLQIIGILNDANGAFERLTGGTSLVKVVMESLLAVIDGIAAPLIIMAKYISFVSDTINALTHNTKVSAQSMSDAANKTVLLAQGLKQTGTAAHGTKPPLQDVHDIAVANAKAAAQAKTNFENWITQLFALRDAAVAVARSGIGMKEAIAAATQSIKDNGKTLNTNTAAGRANYNALLDVADAAKTQTEAMIRNKSSLVSVALQSEKSKAAFIKLATQMLGDKTAAKKLADQMFAIPNVSRQAILRANIQDLTRKLTNAKAQLADPKLNKDRIPQIKANIAALTAALHKAQAQINALKGKTVPITYTMNGVNFTLNTKNPSGVGRSATGGPISGPGTGTSDTAGLYALSNREYVVKASSASGYGRKAMDSVNQGTATIIPGLAGGGFADPRVNIRGYGVFKSVAQLRKVLGDSFGASSTPGAGSGVQRWRGVALAALAAAHEPAIWIGSLLARMQRESGGNPRAINLWDSNAKAGTPSIGLMQTIGPTFNAYAGAYRSRGIYDPFANIYAAIRYTVARYGSGPAGWNKAGGYKNGGWLMPGQLAYNETRRPEAVFNQQQLAAMNRPIIVQLVLDGKVIQQSLLKLNRNKGYAGLGFGRGEGHN